MPTNEQSDSRWMTDEQVQQVAHILRHLLKYEVFLSWESYLHKYSAQEYGLCAGRPFTTPTPVAFCDRGGRDPARGVIRIFSTDHEELDEFNPFRNLADTWKLIQALAAQEDPRVDGLSLGSVFFQALRSSVTENDEAVLTLKDFAALTPARLFAAVWKAFEHLESPTWSPKERAYRHYMAALELIESTYTQRIQEADHLTTPEARTKAYHEAQKQRDEARAEAHTLFEKSMWEKVTDEPES